MTSVTESNPVADVTSTTARSYEELTIQTDSLTILPKLNLEVSVVTFFIAEGIA